LGDLGKLADAESFTEPLDVSGCEQETLKRQLRTMLTIRFAEEKIGDMVSEGKVVCPCHLGIGQEAIAAGVSTGLRPADRVFGAHRSHSHYLAMGGDVYGLFAEVLGKKTGCSGGMGGSMHLFDQDIGFLGAVPIVAATIPIAAGAALAARMDGAGDIAVSYFGDGATEEGVFHESLNIASSMSLPIVFICENNLFASHLHISIRQPENSIARFAEANRIDSEVIDGNDVIAVTEAAAKAINSARDKGKPAFIEAVTYRWRGHVGPREDIDVGVQRSEDLHKWKARDPVRRLYEGMERAGMIDSDSYALLQQEIRDLVATAWSRAETAPYPDTGDLIDLVYFEDGKDRA
jgi:pyruvate dehydrogenase E1 component alpha subunit